MIIKRLTAYKKHLKYNECSRANKSERLKIRVFRLSDLERLEILFSKKENMDNIYSGKVLSNKETREYLIDKYIKQQYTMYGIEHDNSIVGIIGYYDGKYLDKRLTNKILLRIMIDVDYRGKGFGKESLKGITKYLLNILKYKKIYSLIEIDNIASINLHEKVGFKKQTEMTIKNKNYILCVL